MEKTIYASLPVNYSIDNSFDNEKFLKLRLDFAHDGINRKRTRFSSEILEAKKSGLFLSPLLGHIVRTEDGSYKFGSHDMEFRPNPFKNNEVQTFYLENILGIIPPEEYADFEIKQVNGQSRVFVTGYLYKKYSNFAEDLLREYESTPISMETEIKKYTYSADEDVYDVLDFEYKGITFLGQEVTTGMIDANAQVYAVDDEIKDQMVIMLQDLKNFFSLNADDTNTEKGGLSMENNQEVTPVEAISDNSSDVVETVNAENTTETVDATVESNGENPIPEAAEVITEVEVQSAETSETEVSTENFEQNTPANFVKSFSISHEDIRTGLYNKLVPVEEADQEEYFIENVYNDYFEYYACNKKKTYRQKYAVNADGTIDFVETRIELYVEKLTSDEKAVLDAMRQNYDSQVAELNSLKEFKANYDMAEKQSVMDKWATKIGNTQEFAELTANEQFKNYAVEELETKCKCIFADNTAFSCNFAVNSKKEKDFNPVSISVNTTTETNENAIKPYNGFIEEYSSK